MKEVVAERLALAGGVSPLRAALAEMREFAVQSFRSFIGTRGAFRGVFFSLMPAGAMSLGLALQTNLAVELGMDNDEVGRLNLVTSLLSAACMVLGGWLSDKLGRRITLALYLIAMSLPVLYLMWILHEAGYVMPRPPGGQPMPGLIRQLWIANIGYAVFQGLGYGTRSAIMMDVTNPRVAATQFTAYMAMMNLAIAFAASWQGVVIEAWGYPTTLLVDAITGPLCCLLLPAMKETTIFTDQYAQSRARRTAGVLGIAVLSFVVYWPNRAEFGSGQEIFGTFYTLVFVAAALFLLAGREVLGVAAGAKRHAALWVAPLLLAMWGRHWIDRIPDALQWPAQALMYATAIGAGGVLLALAAVDWRGTAGIETELG
jgi:PAT family beta-lactamase induction signal transducer AmpG